MEITGPNICSLARLVPEFRPKNPTSTNLCICPIIPAFICQLSGYLCNQSSIHLFMHSSIPFSPLTCVSVAELRGEGDVVYGHISPSGTVEGDLIHNLKHTHPHTHTHCIC